MKIDGSRSGSNAAERIAGPESFFQYIGAKPPSDEQIAALEQDPGNNAIYGRLQALNLFVILEAYDRYGVTVRSLDGDQSRSFVPWGLFCICTR